MAPPPAKRPRREAGKAAEARIGAFQDQEWETTPACIDRLNAATRAEQDRAFQAKFNEEAIRMRPNHPVKGRHFTAARVIHDALPASRLDVFDPSGDKPEVIPFENVEPINSTSSRK